MIIILFLFSSENSKRYIDRLKKKERKTHTHTHKHTKKVKKERKGKEFLKKPQDRLALL